MIHTGIFATDEEFEDLKTLSEMGWQDGETVFITSIMHGMSKDRATVDAQKACHRIALSHGLPEIEGYYGITRRGEFVYY